MIKKIAGGKYRLYSKKKGSDGKAKNLGTFNARGAAKKHEAEVEYFKRKK